MSTSGHSRSASLAPSDSLSQAPSRVSSLALPSISPFHQPASRPDDYPPEVLWCLEDCKRDHDVKISPGNESRPPMQSAIRNADGTLISDGVWDAIKLSSRHVAHSLLSIDLKGRNANRSKTKQLFKSFFNAEWNEALTQLEQMQPLLRLCAAHWKADHVLGNTLVSMTSAQSSTRTSTKRHAQEIQTPASSKKPRKDEITANALRNMHVRNGNTPLDSGIASTSEAVTAKPSPFLPRGGSTLGTASFSRQLDEGSAPGSVQLSGIASSATALNVLAMSQPPAVDPSCSNLIGM